MREPEFRAFADAPLVQEDRPVLVPRLGFLGGPIHGFEDRRLALRGVEQFAQLPLLERVLLRHLRDEVLHVGAMRVDRGGAAAAREPEQAAARSEAGRDRRRAHAVRNR